MPTDNPTTTKPSDADHLQFIYDRLINFKGDKPGMRHMRELERIIARVRHAEALIPQVEAVIKQLHSALENPKP